ncbi:DUF998 domain-containing protein [Dactylosporangium sp. CS-047395]|uniref:DUF998 domain-containing protein n=1 Tax=Dactylosporangium sp. CS-047395 TaxID=3239936 RepID=UPI003D8E3F28
MTDVQVPTRLGRRLVAGGALAVAGFLVVFHVDAATRPGFVLLRHGPSLLMLGDRGWIQVVNFISCGLLMVGCAAGLRRLLHTGRAARWGPRLLTVYGLAMVGTAVFRTDPQLGYPPGTPDSLLPGTNAAESWHSGLHTLAVLVLYAATTAGCFVFARRFAREDGGRWWAVGLAANGIAAPVVLIVGAFVLQTLSVTSTGSSGAFQLADGIAGRIIIPLGWVWSAVVALRVLATAP